MTRILVIGIGAGDPDQLTVQAIRALNEADVLFSIDRGAEDLVALRDEICRRHLRPDRQPRVVEIAEPRRDRAADDYEAAVHDWRRRRADVWAAAIAGELGDEGTGAFLVWGDPSLYDSTIAVLDDIRDRGWAPLQYDVIPGVSSVHALTARHGIALNRVGGAVQITTGRRLARDGFPSEADDVVVMLDGQCAFTTVDDPDVEIFWGAYLGTPDERLIAGPVTEVAAEIVSVRAAARARKGWVMDCYLLRRRPAE
jgi:precorrin-6A synthase